MVCDCGCVELAIPHRSRGDLVEYEVVAEFQRIVSGVDVPVKAKILRALGDVSEHLRFEIRYSHYFKPSPSAGGVYRPSGIASRTVDEAKHSISAYLGSFTAEFGVEQNESY